MNNSYWTFFQGFLKSPKIVAAALPSSRFVERRLLRAGDPSTAKVIVELGGGTGGTTRSLLKAMRPDAKLIVIEYTERFIDTLKAIGDERLEVVHGCASRIGEILEERGIAGADMVVSGIPFSTMPPELGEEIAEAVSRTLSPGGRFVAYQYTDWVERYTAPFMGPADRQRELRNLPPLQVFTWRKNGDARMPHAGMEIGG